jgi:hypothetical protein
MSRNIQQYWSFLMDSAIALETIAIAHLNLITIRVVGIGADFAQCVGFRDQPIEVVIGIGGGVASGVSNRELSAELRLLS